VRNATLTRFFSLHFILPFVLRVIVIFHIVFLHETGSSNPIGVSLNLDKITFSSYFVIKDIFGVMVFERFLKRVENEFLLVLILYRNNSKN